MSDYYALVLMFGAFAIVAIIVSAGDWALNRRDDE